jgi:hypothetical protein
MEEKEKAALGGHTFSLFLSQFGDDIYCRILFEELMKGIMYEETLFVFGEPEQEGDQITDSSAGSDECSIPSNGCGITETSTSLGEKDSTDCPQQSDEL